MTVSVVIPALNEELTIGGVLSAVARQTTQVDEVIVVDGGSVDSTVAVAEKFPNVRVIHAAPPVGRQRQIGLESSKGDFVVFLDADTLPEENFVAACIEEMRRRRLDIACPWYKPFPSSPAIGAVYSAFNLIFFALQKVLPSGAGSCIIVKRNFALEAGGFRDDLVYEDIEFIRRLGRRGRFGTLSVQLKVSDRRFRKYGVPRMLAHYAALSAFFTFGLFKQAQVLKYEFGTYDRAVPELVVLVDEYDNPIGTAQKSTVHGSHTPLHRAFSVFLFDRSNRVLLQRRSARKATWPLWWSNSCCGHPLPGESTEAAARRRLEQELGISKAELWTVVPHYRYRADYAGKVENEICPVLVAFTDQTPKPNPAEVEEIRWVNWEELVLAADENSELTPWCVEEVRLLERSQRFYELLNGNRKRLSLG